MPSVTAGRPRKGERARVRHTQLLRAVTFTATFTETESRAVGAGHWAGGRGSYCLTGAEFRSGKMKNSRAQYR